MVGHHVVGLVNLRQLLLESLAVVRGEDFTLVPNSICLELRKDVFFGNLTCVILPLLVGDLVDEELGKLLVGQVDLSGHLLLVLFFLLDLFHFFEALELLGKVNRSTGLSAQGGSTTVEAATLGNERPRSHKRSPHLLEVREVHRFSLLALSLLFFLLLLSLEARVKVQERGSQLLLHRIQHQLLLLLQLGNSERALVRAEANLVDVEELLQTDVVRRVDLELVIVVALEAGDQMEQQLRTLIAFKQDVTAFTLQLESEHVALRAVQDVRADLSHIDGVHVDHLVREDDEARGISFLSAR